MQSRGPRSGVSPAPGSSGGITDDFEMLFTFKSTENAIAFSAVVSYVTGLHCDIDGNTVTIDSLFGAHGHRIHAEWLNYQAMRFAS